jgi:hypothetical protein
VESHAIRLEATYGRLLESNASPQSCYTDFWLALIDVAFRIVRAAALVVSLVGIATVVEASSIIYMESGTASGTIIVGEWSGCRP